MKEIAERLRVMEQEVAAEKGPFMLFALFRRDDALRLWDLVVCAPWIDEDMGDSLRYLATKLNEILSPVQILNIARIAIIDTTNPLLEDVQKSFRVEHGLMEVRDHVMFGLPISHAYIVTSRKEAA